MSIRSFASLAAERDDMETDAGPFTAPPSTSNDVDADVPRTPPRSHSNLAHLLGITVAYEDDMPGAETGEDNHMFNHFGEADQEHGGPQEQWHAPAAWSSYPTDDATSEEQPLIDKRHDNEGKERRKGKTRQRLAGLNPFRRRKAAAAAKSGSAPPSLFGRTAGAQSPFGDEHALAPDSARRCSGEPTAQDEQMDMDTHDGPGPSPDPTPSTPRHDVAFPFLAAAPHTGSAPTTPRQSPKSGSARSWLSEVSNSSGLSSASSLLRKNVRRRARLSAGADGSQPRLRSMRKTVQMLGPEAAGAIVKGTNVSPNKLRYMDVGRQVRAYVKRNT